MKSRVVYMATPAAPQTIITWSLWSVCRCSRCAISTLHTSLPSRPLSSRAWHISIQMFPKVQSSGLTPSSSTALSSGDKVVPAATPPHLATLTSLPQSKMLFLKELSENRIPTVGCLQFVLQLGTSHLQMPSEARNPTLLLTTADVTQAGKEPTMWTFPNYCKGANSHFARHSFADPKDKPEICQNHDLWARSTYIQQHNAIILVVSSGTRGLASWDCSEDENNDGVGKKREKFEGSWALCMTQDLPFEGRDSS